MKKDNIDNILTNKIDQLLKADDLYIDKWLIDSLLIILNLKNEKKNIDILKNMYGTKKIISLLLLYSYYNKTFNKNGDIDILKEIIKE